MNIYSTNLDVLCIHFHSDEGGKVEAEKKKNELV
jgi:hypothetical protein